MDGGGGQEMVTGMLLLLKRPRCTPWLKIPEEIQVLVIREQILKEKQQREN